MPKSRLELSVEIFRSLADRTVSRARARGVAKESDLSAFVRELEQAGLLVSSNEETKVIEFSAISLTEEFFAESLSDLTAGTTRKKRCPREFYIADTDYLHGEPDNNPSPNVQAYLDTVCLVEALGKVADHGKEITSRSLIFFHKEKIELHIDYNPENIKPIPSLRRFIDQYIDDEIHADQKKTILKSVLHELSKEFEGRKLDIGLINEIFDEFARRVSSGYQLYVSEFSYQKVRAEIEKSKFDFITKINKVFSDIQNQLLTVPAALIIAGSQFEASDHVTLKNILILSGALAFTIFMLLLIVNQRNTLTSISNEVDNEWKLIKKKHNAIKDQFDVQYHSLESRYRHQYMLLEVVALIVILACIATILLFNYNSSSQSISPWLAIALGLSLAAYITQRVFNIATMIYFEKMEN